MLFKKKVILLLAVLMKSRMGLFRSVALLSLEFDLEFDLPIRLKLTFEILKRKSLF